MRRNAVFFTLIGGTTLWLFALLLGVSAECSTPLGSLHRSGFTHAFCTDPAPWPAHLAVNLLGLMLPLAGIALATYGAATARHRLIPRGAALIVLPILLAWIIAAHFD